MHKHLCVPDGKQGQSRLLLCLVRCVRQPVLVDVLASFTFSLQIDRLSLLGWIHAAHGL